MFDGKIGLWPLTETFVAQRNSVNRVKGTICTRNVATVDRQLYKHYIVDHVIPIRAVTDAFEETSVKTLDNIFITLQCVMQCIMEKEGGNWFSLPHIGKEVLRKKGELPERITCDSAVYDLAVSALERAGQPMLF